ncbi:hypothetical protein GCM10009798_13840 [Nocardioides panacihumi]|uniref:DUF4279 domain-containing protein n=1 Tax=Nocardioides panacihumi TaxID=400774 RepID=A0ABN2QP65_9ACTN
MQDESWVEQYAEFSVNARSFDGDFDPELITQTLGLEPSDTSRRGETVDDEPVNASTWSWVGPRRIEFRCEAVLDDVLETFGPVADLLALARDRYDVEYTVRLVIDMHGFVETSSLGEPDFLVATPAPIFNPATLSRLVALGCRFVLEQTVHADAHEYRQPE